jgi:hypothetical protein
MRKDIKAQFVNCAFFVRLDFQTKLMGFILLLLIGAVIAISFTIKKGRKLIIANLLAIIIYNVLGWYYIFKFMDHGGASLGPGLLLLFGTAIHIVVMFIFAIVRLFIERKKRY